MSYRRTLTAGLVVLATVATSVLLLSGLGTSRAVQAPKFSLDMVPSGNSYSDPGSGGDNSMSVGTTENCSTTAPPGNNNAHIHPVHVVIRDVEDLVGWDLRMNYDGGKMRPASVNFAPFVDNSTGQGVSFINLPLDSTTGIHRDIVSATDIPPAAAGPQTALAGSVYQGAQDAPISPDTPPKAAPDDTSYSAPTGGVLATINLQVLAGNAGNASLFMNLDDNNPNAPGTQVHVFTTTGLQTIPLTSSALGDGFHGEGATCVAGDCTNGECPPGPATPTPCQFCTPSTEVTFVNETAQAASQIHIELPFDRPTSTAGVVQNAPGCPSPTTHVTPPIDSYVTVDWGVACVDPGESVRIFFASDTQSAPAPEVSCFYWSRLGAFIEGQSPPCARTFVNDTGQTASDLHIVIVNFSGNPGTNVGLVQNAPGCPSPTYSFVPRDANRNEVDVDWGVACVDPGESAAFIFIPPNSANAPTRAESFSWTFDTTPTPTPAPVAGHDARLTRISGVPKNVRLSPGEVITDSASVVVANDSNHAETIGVYVDVVAHSGCTPNGRVLQTTVTLNAGAKTTLSVPVSYSCSDPSAANGQSYAWTAVADHGADDLAGCGPGSLQTLMCFNVLADDDADPADNRKARTGPKVVAQ